MFADNDRPGVMLAGAARTYLDRYAVAPGSARAVVFTTNDSAYEPRRPRRGRCAGRSGGRRPRADARSGANARHGIEVLAGASSRDRGSRSGAPSRTRRAVAAVACDTLLAVGRLEPGGDLFSQAQGVLRYDPSLAAFVPASGAWARWLGAAGNGAWTCAEGARRVPAAARGRLPGSPRPVDVPPVATGRGARLVLWRCPAASGLGALRRPPA